MLTNTPDPNARYRVRDKDWKSPSGDHSKALHGEDLTLAEAHKLKERVVSLERISTTARVEPMAVPAPDWWLAQYRPNVVEGGFSESDPVADKAPPSAQSGATIEIADHQPREAPCNGVVRVIPPRSELLVNGQRQPLPVSIMKGDRLEAVSLDPTVAVGRAAAAAAVAQVMQRRVPTDVTIRPRVPRTQPPPPDKTLSQQPTVIRLGAPPASPAEPLPSPLKVAEIPDGDPVMEGDIADADVQDLAVDLGGGPTTADLDHAKRQAEADRNHQ